MTGRDGAITPREPLGNHQHEGQWMRHWMECTWWQVGGGTSQYPHFSEDLQFPPRYLGPHTGPQMVTLGRTEH